MKSAVLLVLAALLLAGCASNPETPTPGATTTPTTNTPTPTSPTPATPAPSGAATEEDFESATLGAVPAGWTVATGTWSVRENETAPNGPKVLYSDKTELPETSILADEAGAHGDFTANVSFNILGGEKAQAGGVIFRQADEKNYYVIRYNHAEGQWNLFRTIDGKREKFAATNESADFQGALHQWIPLSIEANGNHMVARSGDLTVIDYTEKAANAPTSGKIGLWTRYDSMTEFDGFHVGPASA